MKKEIFRKFFISLASIFVGLIFGLVVSVLAWVNPSQNPPLGGGVLQTDTSGLKIVTTTQVTSGNFTVNTGNVGIGTTAPSVKLHVYESATNKSGALINIAATSSSYYSLDVQSGGISRLYVRADGNVGIGTTAPAYKLDVVGDIRASGTAYLGITITSSSCSSASTCSVTCPAGSRVLGGGCYSSGTSYSYALVRSYPNTDTSWYCQTAAATTLTAYAICARIGP